ncbi:MAG TPA: hypothetical protein VK906_13945 [Egicoccus sp.]|nr:hypothetical protein [Egicoccus sp.]HSK24282.1 hypothetical protein [Egicoccus sp.]
MPRHHRPAKRLLIAPALLLIGILAVVTVTHRLAEPPAADPSVSVEARLPAVAAYPGGDCRRDRSGPVLPQAPPIILDGRITAAMVTGCPVAFDGRRVTFAGEVVGDLLARDGGAWALVNDDDYALRRGPLPSHSDHRGSNSGLSVWLPSDLAAEVSGVGRPGRRGDVVVVEGVIRRHDPEDGGGLTLRADRLSVIAPSQDFEEPFDVPQAVLALGSVVAAVLLWTARARR